MDQEQGRQEQLTVLNNNLQRLWSLESAGLKVEVDMDKRRLKASQFWTETEKEADRRMKVRFDEEQGRYVAAIPWKDTRDRMTNNRSPVVARQAKSNEERALARKGITPDN